MLAVLVSIWAIRFTNSLFKVVQKHWRHWSLFPICIAFILGIYWNSEGDFQMSLEAIAYGFIVIGFFFGFFIRPILILCKHKFRVSYLELLELALGVSIVMLCAGLLYHIIQLQ